MKNGNGDRTSKYSAMYGQLDKPNKKKKSVHRSPRLGGKQRNESISKGGGSDYSLLADIVEKTIGKPIKISKPNWYLYNGGVWKLVGESDRFLHHAWTVQDLATRNDKTGDRIIKSLVYRHSLKEDEKFYGCIRPDMIDPTCYLINCPNSVLKIDFVSGRIIEKIGQSDTHMFTSSLAVDYDEKAKCPRFLEVAKQILPDENDRELLLLFFAYCLLPSCKLETALFCIGSGGNGKSVLTNTIANVFGRENRLSITLKEICKKDRKQLIRLERKLVNLSTEVEVDPIKDSATFKMLVSGEDIETDILYREGVTINPGCKYCLLMNHMPEFGKGSNAESRRTRIIHFPIEFEGDKRNPNLAKELDGEKAGILNLLVARLSKVATMKFMPLGGSESKLAQESFGVSNNPITAFVREFLVITNDRNDYVSRKKIWSMYNEFASNNNLETKSHESFSNEFHEYYPKTRVDSNVRKVIDGRQERIVRFVRSKK